MYLANELKTEIASHLDKKSLKAVRFANKEWSACTLKFLFDKLYVSSHGFDLEVFTALTTASDLGPYVKTLLYDTTKFLPSSSFVKKNYFQALCKQIRTSMKKSPDNVLVKGDEELQLLVGAVIKRGSMAVSLVDVSMEAWIKCQDLDIVANGFKLWKKLANEQEQQSSPSMLVPTLVRGLQKLSNLETVTIHSTWHQPDHHTIGNFVRAGKQGVGSPLTRSWNPFHLYPLTPDCDFYDDFISSDANILSSLDGSIDFGVLTTALHEAKVTPRHLDSNINLASPVLPIGGPYTFTTCVSDFFPEVYGGLKHLDVHMRRGGKLRRRYPYAPMDVLRLLLDHLPELTSLTLDLPEKGRLQEYYNFHTLFPAQTKIIPWEHLVRVSVMNLNIDTEDLVKLLLVKMPQVRRVYLEKIVLLSGHWEGLIEFMSRCLALECLEIGVGGDPELLYRGGTRFDEWVGHPWFRNPIDSGGWDEDFNSRLEFYVTEGGRHPCLERDDKQSLVDEWFRDTMSFPGGMELPKQYQRSRSTERYVSED